MCFEICTINIRDSIRVRGLHLVLDPPCMEIPGYVHSIHIDSHLLDIHICDNNLPIGS